MKQELRDKWVAALRSGEYRQGKDWLKVQCDGLAAHCCLGVLSELLPHGPIGGWYWNSDNGRWDLASDKYDEERYELPVPVRESLGWGLPLVEELMSMNDGTGPHKDSGRSFSEIADYIEANIPVDPEAPNA